MKVLAHGEDDWGFAPSPSREPVSYTHLDVYKRQSLNRPPNRPHPKRGGYGVNSVLVRHKWEPYVWLLPSILLMTIFVVFPIGIVFKLAFSEISKSGIVGGFIGLQNFKDAVSAPVFGTVMLNTVVWVVSVVGLSTLFGFIVAMTLNQKFVGRKIARSIVVFPWATSLVIQALSLIHIWFASCFGFHTSVESGQS